MFGFNVKRKLKQMKKTLIIAPHPDDEILGCYGWIEKELSLGHKVDIYFMAVGTSKKYSGLDEVTKNVRENEIKECRKVVNYKETDEWSIMTRLDGKLDTIPESKIVKELDVLLNNNYDYVFIPYPSLHIDHRVTYNSALASLRLKENHKNKEEVYIYEYPFIKTSQSIQGGDVFIEMSEETIKNKVKAFETYKSQNKNKPSPLNEDGIRTLAKMRGMEVGIEYAEKYYLIRKVMFTNLTT